MSSLHSVRTDKVIFVVDDDEDVLFHINYWFLKNRFLPITFKDSKTMFEALENVSPDLVLLDVNLQNEDGRCICRHLKEERRLQAPVVLLSAYPRYGDNASQWSANGFLEKDSDYFRLAKKLEPFFTSANAM